MYLRIKIDTEAIVGFYIFFTFQSYIYATDCHEHLMIFQKTLLCVGDSRGNIGQDKSQSIDV